MLVPPNRHGSNGTGCSDSKLAKLQLAHEAAASRATADVGIVREDGSSFSASPTGVLPTGLEGVHGISEGVTTSIMERDGNSEGAGTSWSNSSLLLGLEKKPLLKVFVYLNAVEVLYAALVCRDMFQKVRLRYS